MKTVDVLAWLLLGVLAVFVVALTGIAIIRGDVALVVGLGKELAVVAFGIAFLLFSVFWLPSSDKLTRLDYSREIQEAARMLGFTEDRDGIGLAEPEFVKLLHPLGVGEVIASMRGHLDRTKVVVLIQLVEDEIPRACISAAYGLDPARPCCRFSLRPYEIGWFGRKNVRVDDGNFSRRYRVLGSDEPAIRALFDRRIIDALAADVGWLIEGDEQWLVVTRWKDRPIPTFLADATKIFRLLAPR